MMRSLKAFAVENPHRSPIRQIHDNAQGEQDSENQFKLEKGVRQGCVIVPQIFSLIFDVCKKSRVPKDHLAYADDLVMPAKSEQQAQSKLNKLSLEVENAGMEIEFPKKEIMTVNMEKACNVTLQGKGQKKVTEFKYLGSILNGQSDIEAAARSKFNKARIAAVKMRPALVMSTLTMRIKCLIEMCVKPKLLHRLEKP